MTKRKAISTRREPATTVAPRPGRPRVPMWAQRILAPLVFGAVAAGCGWLAIIGVWNVATTLVSGARVVDFSPREAICVPLCVAFALLAAMGMLPDPEIRLRPSRRSPAARRANRIATPLFAGVAVAMLATTIASPVAWVAMKWTAKRQGYASCPTPPSDRHGEVRWARPATACPAVR